MLTDLIRNHRSVDAVEIPPVGWKAHREGVDKLLRSFCAVPKDKRVRLAKKTSNLFRGRSGEQAGLDVSGLDGVIEVDPIAQTAEVQGMCTYEDLVDATLPHGLMPFVVPQLKTITLGGAVTGMGVESTSFRDGLPHESVLEMDVLTGTGDIVTCSREENVDLFRLFPNSYGSLGYAVRLKIELRAVKPYVELREVRFHDFESLAHTLDDVSRTHTYDDVEVHGLDGVVFSPEESYLVMARFTDEEGPTSDYTREKIFYRSLQHANGIRRDRLTVRDYIWRWDTDWFWCSRAFGAQNPRVRKVWPRQLRRSSFYWKLVRLDRKYELEYNFIKKPKGLPRAERVVQDIEVTPDNLPEFLDWFFQASGIQPVWLCPIRLREGVEDLADTGTLAADSPAPWPLYPLRPGQTWINVGFWSGVEGNHVDPSAPGNGAFNRVIEDKVSELGGHKSLYSEAFYSPEEFAKLYGGNLPERIKAVTDPDGRFPGLYEKTVNEA
ncbi:FAD-binding oxidoreductase [Corynebacterium sp. HMSC062A03]|uniref:FAD-binding oxidoreductase n=1 Tax=Corynebacterium sp. HMSC062A03 TaxID=1739285 RepID=UPI0008A29611|nr:FAD-binding oxidoreductase [Corynebacterium sp. HMSC062A03]OFL24632.1 dehydrogenase [Corynebacterium sp. HMSC062A03]